ncbi:hypothetical protein Tco_0304151 [Tanacetum coccineum]
MAANQAIEYAPQCGYLTVESLNFHNNNVVGVFRYTETTPVYHEICKYLMNCPLDEAFTKAPSVVYQNLIREYDALLLPLTQTHLLMTLRLDYAKGTYVSHPSLEAVKDKLAKIIENPILLDMTLVLKTKFPMTWRILFTFVVQVLGENYSSTEQVNSIQQLFAYCLLTGTKGPEAPGSIPQNKKKPKFKKTPRETKGNIQFDGIGLPSILDQGTCKSQPLHEGTTTNPKDLRGNVQPVDKGLPSMASNEGTTKTMPRPEGPLRDKDSEGNKPPADMKPINPTVVDPSRTAKTSSKVEPDPETVQLTTLADIQDYLLSEDELAQESDEEASIEGYYEENVDHKEQTDKLVQATMDSLNKTAIDKDDPALNNVIEATKAYTKNLSALTELLNLVKNFDFQGLKSLVESLQAAGLRQDEHLASWVKSSNSLAWNLGPRMKAVKSSHDEIRSKISSLKQDTSYIKSIMTDIFQAFKEPPSHTEEEHVAMEDNKAKEEPTREVALIESSSKSPLTDPILEIHVPQREGKAIATDDQPEVQTKPVLASKNAKAGEKFKKAQDAEHQVLKREHSQKAKRAMKLRKKRSLPEGVPFVNNMVIEEPEYEIFFTDVFDNQAFQRWNDIHKVRVDSLVSLVIASMIKTQDNARFSLNLRKFIVEHPDQEKLKSKSVKLEALGYKLD